MIGGYVFHIPGLVARIGSKARANVDPATRPIGILEKSRILSSTAIAKIMARN